VSGRLTHALPVLLMLLLGGLTLWLRQAIETPTTTSPVQAGHDVDATVEKFTVTRLDEMGQPSARLSADRMLHYGDDDSTELYDPELLKTDPGATLTVRADRGVVSQDYEEARFFDNVRLVRKDADSPDALQVRTQYLHVLISRELVLTDRPVTLIRGASTLTGTGMEYDRKSGQLSLSSSVHASFDARRR
jgi:lipopolysaccharide export system protein LptC